MNIRITSFIVAVLILILQASPAVRSQTCAPMPTGIVSWWAAEGSGADRFNRNNAVMVGDASFVAGKVGQAFSFDGSGDYAQAANPNSLPVGAAPRTVELWFKAPATPGESGLFQYGTASYAQMFGLITSGNAPGRLYFYGHSADLPANTVIQPDTWYHGAVTYDGTTVKIYINGQLENSAAMTLNTAVDTNGITIGHRAGGSFWTGQIDEPTLYDRALTDAEIAAIYNAGSAGKCYAVCSTAPAGITNWWQAEGNMNDSVGSGNGSLGNGAAFAAGKVGQSLIFDGVDDYATVPASSDWAFGTGDFTVQFWEYADGSVYKRPLVNNRTSTQSEAEWAIEVYNVANRVEFHSGYTILLTATNLLNSSNWNHIAVTRVGGTMTIYINGVASGSTANANNFSEVNALQLARDLLPAGQGDLAGPFQGKIDELSILRRGLSLAEIQAIYNAGSGGMCPSCAPTSGGIINWWPGDGNANDLIGGSNGTPQGGMAYGTGKVRTAFSFDGIDDYVDISMPQINTVDGAMNTVDFWMYWRGNDIGPSSDGRMPFGFAQTYDLYLYAGSFGFNTGASDIWGISSTGLANRWVHVTAVFTNGDARNNKLYIDGVAQTLTQRLGTTGSKSVTQNARISGWAAGGPRSYAFDGLVDEVDVYNRELTAAEVTSIYNAGITGKCQGCTQQPANVISWWHGEDNVHDAVGANYGVLLGGAAFAPGRVGRAFSFNGSTAAVRIPDSPTLDVTTDFTLGAWIKPASIPSYPNGALVMSKIGPIGNLNGYQMAVSNIGGTNRIWCGFNTGGSWPQYTATGGSVPAGEWTYIACTYDHNTLAVYQNGEPAGSSVVGPVTVANTTSNLKLGSDDVGQQFYAGLIDEPMIAGRALSASELRSIYAAGSFGTCPPATPFVPSCAGIPPGMLSWWRGENNPLDRRKANPGTLWGTTAFSPGKVGKGFGFAAGNEAVDVGTWFDRQVFSIEMWVKPNNGQIQYANIIDNNHYSSPLRSWVLEDLNTGNIFQWYSADFPAGTNILFELVPDTWQHIVITRDANRVTRGYLNRSLVGTVTTSVDIPYDGTQHLRIGNWYGGNRAFNGTIDEVSIYGRALNETEIAALYNADSYGKCVGGQTMADMDGDMLSDLAIFRPSGTNGADWWWLKSTGGNGAVQFGSANDAVVTADYTGDGKTDIAYWQPSTGFWYVLRSEDLTYYAFPFGGTGDVPVPADYDGDGRADAAVFRASNTTWYISRTTGGTGIVQFGAAGDKPVVDDYDGDGKADIAVFRPNGTGGAEWWIMQSSGGVFATQFGQPTDKAVPADYTGDGRADIAFWQPATGYWFVLRSDDYSYYAFPFGAAGDMPVPADYDGDAKTDAAVYRPTTSNWFISRTKDGLLIRQFGSTGDVPVPSAFVR